MARDHTPEPKQEPQVLEREINLALLNAKLNDLTGLCLEIADKVGVKKDED